MKETAPQAVSPAMAASPAAAEAPAVVAAEQPVKLAMPAAATPPAKTEVAAPVAAAPPAGERESPEAAASWLSQMFFVWVNGLFKLEKGEVFKESSLLPLIPSDNVADVSSKFESLLKEEVEKQSPSPVKAALMRQFKTPFIAAGVVKWANSTAQFAPSLLLNGLLKSMADRSSAAPQDPQWAPYIWALGLFLSLSVRTFIENRYFHMITRVGFNARTAITTAVYRKSLRMSPTARQEVPVGQIVNLMQSDSTRIEGLINQLHVVWDALYQIAGYMLLLGLFIGWSSLAGLATMLLLVPINLIMMKKMSAYRQMIVRHNDSRIKVTNEVLQAMKGG